MDLKEKGRKENFRPFHLYSDTSRGIKTSYNLGELPYGYRT